MILGEFFTRFQSYEDLVLHMANYSTSGSRMDVVTCAGGLGIELLNRSNYKVWRTCMESYLVGEDLWDVVDGEQVRNPEASAENSEALKKWKQLNAKAEFALKRSISSCLFDGIEECKSAHEIWRALNSSFSQRNISFPVENRLNNLEDFPGGNVFYCRELNIFRFCLFTSVFSGIYS